MKKLLFLLVAICMVAAANAQLVTTSSYTVKKDKSKILWMIRAGLNAANVSCDKDFGDPKSIVGYNVSIEFNRPFATNFYWGSGLVFANGGYKDSDSTEKGSGYELSYEDKYSVAKLEVPVNFGYKFGLTDDLKLDAHVGAYVGYDLFGTNSYKETYNGDTDSEDIKLGDWEDYNRLNYGLQFGVGVWYRNFNFNINFQKGLANKYDGDGDLSVKEKNWMFSVGYAF